MFTGFAASVLVGAWFTELVLVVESGLVGTLEALLVVVLSFGGLVE